MDDPVTEAMRVLRCQRHSFLNHLQVISGWLQMNQPERASHHVAELAERMAAESSALGQVPPDVGLRLLNLALEAETHGVRVEWHVLPPVVSIAEPELAAFLAQALAAVQAVSGRGEQERWIRLVLGADGFWVHTPSGRGTA